MSRWLLRILRRTVFTWIAKNRHKDLVFMDDLEGAEKTNPGGDPAFAAELTATPEQVVLVDQRSTRDTAPVNALPLRFREVIMLREMENLSYREIAEIFEILDLR